MVPFGVYELAGTLLVKVGTSHNTAEFAVNCLVNLVGVLAGWRTHEAIGCSSSPTVAAATVITCGFGKGIYKKGCVIASASTLPSATTRRVA